MWIVMREKKVNEEQKRLQEEQLRAQEQLIVKLENEKLENRWSAPTKSYKMDVRSWMDKTEKIALFLDRLSQPHVTQN